MKREKRKISTKGEQKEGQGKQLPTVFGCSFDSKGVSYN